MSQRPNYRKKIGKAPGSLIYTGNEKSRRVGCSLTAYNKDFLEEREIEDYSSLINEIKEGQVSWIDLDGIHDVSIIQSVGEQFDIHPLVLEDILSTENRPKIDEFEDYLFFTATMLSITPDKKLNQEQISLILGKNYVLSFQEEPGDVFTSVRTRIRGALGRIRNSHTDYLVYILLDAIVDHYYFIEERIQAEIDAIETSIYEQTYEDKAFMQRMQALRKEIVVLRKAVNPLRESVLNLKKGTSDLVTEPTVKFLGDLMDHIQHIHDSTELFRENTNGIIDLYHSFQSSRLNEVMKVLTVISTIFIPLGFLAGLYGMNFSYMPELQFHYSYFILLSIMLALVVGMVYYFRRKGWI